LSLSEQYYSTIFYFLSAECNKTNNLLQIAYLEPENTIEKIKKAISSYRPDGIFFAGEVAGEIIEYMQKLSIPTVILIFIHHYMTVTTSIRIITIYLTWLLTI
jgi:ABC-type Fe3+-hydroxamate transport system substrate-binding protein